jgi:hypothetical protein
MTVTTASFRDSFPAFQDDSVYPEAAVAMWLGVAKGAIDPLRWDTMTDLGVSLYMAHNLAVDALSNKAAANGGVAGQITGPTTSKSVDKVSVSYDVSSALVEGAGDWNLTVYGLRFIRYARMFGSGGLQAL